MRQGENLSHFLFAIFLNDLEWYFRQNNISRLSCVFNDDDLYMFIKIFILMYAYNTVIFSHSQNDLKKALDTFENYCKEWQLTVNVAKTKIMVILRGRISRTTKEALAIRRVFSLVDMITNTKFSNCSRKLRFLLPPLTLRLSTGCHSDQTLSKCFASYQKVKVLKCTGWKCDSFPKLYNILPAHAYEMYIKL